MVAFTKAEQAPSGEVPEPLHLTLGSMAGQRQPLLFPSPTSWDSACVAGQQRGVPPLLPVLFLAALVALLALATPSKRHWPAAAASVTLATDRVLVVHTPVGQPVTEPNFEEALRRWAVAKATMIILRRLIEAVGPKSTDSFSQAVAYHEGGHVLVALYTEGTPPLTHVSIANRYKAGVNGATRFKASKQMMTRSGLLAAMKVAMGGRAAEELIYGAEAVGIGAWNDIKKATQIARLMVMDLGMSELGMVNLGDVKTLSEKTREKVDAAISRLLAEAYQSALKCLSEHLPELHELAGLLLQKRSLSVKQVRKFLGIPAPNATANDLVPLLVQEGGLGSKGGSKGRSAPPPPEK